MKPLITIETVPITIEYVEKKSSHTDTKQSANLNISQENDVRTIKSDPISISMQDTFETAPSKSLSSLYYTATAKYSTDGNLSMNVQMGDDSENEIAFQQFERGIDKMVDFFPNAAQNSDYQFESMQISFDMSKLSGVGSDSKSVDTNFLPPDLELKVVERAKVIVKYIGGPIYFPKSADPSYEPPEEVNQIFDGKSNPDAGSYLDIRA